MSLPNEIVNAQQRIWDMFVNGEIPREKWPRHLMSGGQLDGLYFWLDELKKENASLKKLLEKSDTHSSDE
jgi:hypothetical protein